MYLYEKDVITENEVITGVVERITYTNEDTLRIIEESSDRLIEVPGIGQKRVSMIQKAWQEQKEIKEVILFLQSNGVSAVYAVKIYKAYGNESISTVKENPYRLADDIWGIGFKTADKIAQQLGFDKKSYERCRSGILYVLNELSNDGHCYATDEQLVKTSTELLEQDEDFVRTSIDRMLQEKTIIADGEDAIYLPAFYASEVGVARRIREILMGEVARKPADIKRIIDDIGTITQINLEDRILRINFDGNEIEYDSTELDEVVLAYATTVHKSQGSEYKIVVAPLVMQHYMMLQRNLLYTCVTRAKKVFVLIGSKKRCESRYLITGFNSAIRCYGNG